MLPIRVAVADDDKSLCARLFERILPLNDMEWCGVAQDGVAACNLLLKQAPDVLLLDMILPRMDGLSVLEWMQGMNLRKRTRVVVLAYHGQEFWLSKAIALGASGTVYRPFTPEEALDVIRYNNLPTPDDAMRPRIRTLLSDMGISQFMKGFSYLEEAIALAIYDDTLVRTLTQKLYPAVAEKYVSTAVRVERDMRHAIETAWNRGQLDRQQQEFGYTIDEKKGKPTNGEFIARMAERLYGTISIGGDFG